MEKENMIIILLVIVVMIAAFQTLQLVSLNNKPAISAAATAGTSNGAPDMTGWTENEKMNYEMHGIIPARAGGGSSGSSGMVGGC